MSTFVAFLTIVAWAGLVLSLWHAAAFFVRALHPAWLLARWLA